MNQAPKDLPHDVHDRGYKLLLSFKQLFQELIEGYVEGEWKARLDYSQCQKIEKSYIRQDLEKQESDLVYRIPLLGTLGTEAEPKEVLLYILIEHQSSIDYGIAFRVLAYLVNLWYDLYKNADENLRRQKTWRLPPVFPIVLYNGNDPWNAPVSLKEIVEHSELFGDYIPNLKYHIIDIGHYDSNKLAALHNALSSLFLLEQSHDQAALSKSLEEISDVFSQEKNAELWKAVFQWIIIKLKLNFSKTSPEALTQLEEAILKKTTKEGHTMLETVVNKIFEQGIEQGIQKGLQEGMKKSILKLLQTRFGQVPKKIEDKILAITQEESLWLLVEKAGTAPTMKEFKDALAGLER